jgi:hypothetical protein
MKGAAAATLDVLEAARVSSRERRTIRDRVAARG